MVSINIPGTSYNLTTDPDEANVASIPDTETVTGFYNRDEVRRGIAEATGVSDYVESEQGQQRLQEAEEAEGALERFDVATAAGTDFLLDNPRGSLQDNVRGAISRVTGLSSEEQAERAQEIDAGVTESIDEQIEGTAFDNPATSFVRKAGDVLIGEGIRTFTGAATGIDPEEGDTDARTGALELADIGLTIGTGGLGRGAVSAARAARAGEGVTTTFRAGDTGVSSAARASDETVSGVDTTTTAAARTSEGARSSEEIVDLFPDRSGVFSVRSADESTGAARAADETENLPASVRSVDETGSAGARSADDVRDSIGRAADEVEDVGGAAARSVDEAASGSARSAEDIATQIRSSLARVGSRIGSGAWAAAATRTARVGATGAALSAGVVGGGAIVTELRDRYEMADGTTLVRVDTLQPSERFQGGALYRVQDANSTIGYGVVVGREGRKLIILDRDGSVRRSQITVEQLQELQQ